jgi:hypothetical protein
MKPNFEEMNMRDLKSYAEQNNIDLQGETKRKAIVDILEKTYVSTENENNLNSESEDNKMDENKEVMVEGTENVEATPAVEETKKYKLDNGQEGSRSEYIRQEFKKDKSRKSIAEELGVKYYIVYSATANMFNAVHPEEGGAAAGSRGAIVPKVNAEFKFVNAAGEVVETAEEAEQVQRAELMRELNKAGKTRSELKDYFQVPYATVYAATKEENADGAPRAKKVVVDPETGVEVPRVEYIRKLFAAGEDRREIAKKLTMMTGDLVDYATVWAATKPAKKEEVAVDAPVDATTENVEA